MPIGRGARGLENVMKILKQLRGFNYNGALTTVDRFIVCSLLVLFLLMMLSAYMRGGGFHRYPAFISGLGCLGPPAVSDSNDDVFHGSRLY
jgi:hypothetical protein